MICVWCWINIILATWPEARIWVQNQIYNVLWEMANAPNFYLLIACYNFLSLPLPMGNSHRHGQFRHLKLDWEPERLQKWGWISAYFTKEHWSQEVQNWIHSDRVSELVLSNSDGPSRCLASQCGAHVVGVPQASETHRQLRSRQHPVFQVQPPLRY